MSNRTSNQGDWRINAIQHGGRSREAALRDIYQDQDLRRMVAAFVRQYLGDAADGEDMFQEGIIVLDRNIREGKFRGEAPLRGYLYSICRFLWRNQARKRARAQCVAEVPVMEETGGETPETELLLEERNALLDDLLSSLGERNRRILEMWKLSYSMAEIAEALGFSSAEIARKAKYRCHLALLETIRQRGVAGLLR